MSCYKPNLASNVSALNSSGRAVSIGTYSLAAIARNISNSVYPHTICNSSAPLFNGSSCVACPSAQFYDLRSLKCISAKIVSNVAGLNATNKTVAIGQYTLAFIQSQIKAMVVPVQVCPASKPLFNGSQCVACPPGEYYLLMTLKCYKPLFSSNLSALNSSGRTVQVGNFTLKILSAQVAAQPFPTKPCPAVTPLFSGGKCIGCPSPQYYDLQTRQCYKPKFASNITELALSGKAMPYANHTLTSLNKSITTSPYPTVPCPRAAPLFNGSACTFCPSGTKYLLSKLTCVGCPNGTVLLSNLSCYLPQLVSNTTALNQSKMFVNQGNATLSNIAAKTAALVLPYAHCPSSAPLFNGSNCIKCPSGTYYLLSNLTCYTPQVVTNTALLLKTNKYINIGNSTLSALNKSVSSSGLPVNACNASAPVFNGTHCIGCPPGSYFFLNNLTCYHAKNVSNITALAIQHRYISRPNHTLLTIEAAINASKLPVSICPSSRPLFNGSACLGCPSGQYFDLKNLSCYKPSLGSNVKALNLSAKSVSIGSFSLKNLASNISSSPLPIQPCPSSKPLYNGSHCIGCNSSQYYDLRSLKCISAKLVSNIAALNATNKTVAIGHYTLAFIQNQIKAMVLPVQVCPASKPLFNGSQCVACPPTEYYLL